MLTRPSLRDQSRSRSDVNRSLTKLTPLSAIFGSMTIYDSYRTTHLIQALNKYGKLRRAYLKPGYQKILMDRPLRVGIVQVRFSAWLTFKRGRNGSVKRAIASATRLLLDLEQEVGAFDIRYAALFIGPPDGEGLLLPIPRDIQFDDPWGSRGAKQTVLTHATGRILNVLPRGSKVHIIGKSVDSVQVDPPALHRFLRHYIKRGLQMELRCGLGDSYTPPMPHECFLKRDLDFTNWTGTIILMMRQWHLDRILQRTSIRTTKRNR
jgi:hypothetical protein